MNVFFELETNSNLKLILQAHTSFVRYQNVSQLTAHNPNFHFHLAEHLEIEIDFFTEFNFNGISTTDENFIPTSEIH